MTTRKSYLQCEADYRARVRAASPDLAKLWDDAGGFDRLPPSQSLPQDDQGQRDRQLEAACERLYGKVPKSQAEKYAAAESLDARQCLKGRGED